jgi:hypothetical protein
MENSFSMISSFYAATRLWTGTNLFKNVLTSADLGVRHRLTSQLTEALKSWNAAHTVAIEMRRYNTTVLDSVAEAYSWEQDRCHI